MEKLPEITELSSEENIKKLKQKFEDALKDEKIVQKIGSFIDTDQAISRLYELESNLLANNYVLIEGPTGSSKTKTIQIYCIIKDLELVQLNMSGETNEEDLKGRILSNPNSFSGFGFKKGLFADAFINGKILLLDEINLANQDVLNFIANALDSKILILEQDENSDGSHIFNMHEKFRLIATQNPNNISYISKREELPEKLLKMFNIVYYPALTEKEIKDISLKIAKKNNFKGEKEENIINEIAEIHSWWINSGNSKYSPQCFTIRDINTVIKSISKEKNPDFVVDSLMCFYGMRYEKKYRQIFYNKLLDSKVLPKNILKCPENEFENFFETESFHQVDKYAKIAIENGRHILFTGKEGVGITSIAKIIADKYSNDKNKDFIFVFTEETTIGDLIGRFIPDSFENNDNVIKWEDGPLTEAIKNGYSGIFLNVDSVDSKILERINCLLDQKESEDDNYFKISENPNLDKIKINEKFRFFCTCSLDKLDSLSDAFLNRLTVINIDNQFENLNIYEDLPNLIKILIKQENLNIEVDKELINCLKKEFENNMDKITMSEYSRLVKCCAHLIKEFPSLEPEESLLYIKSLIQNNKNDTIIPLKISNNFNSKFEAYNKLCNERKFTDEIFYIDSKKIKELIINMYICMICKINICLIGPTGIGKTHLARTFSKIFRGNNEKDIYDILFAFNSESTMENLYGTFAFEGGKTKIVEGPLYKAINEGLIFIADEFNLAEESVIQSLINVLEVNSQSHKVLIPGINKIIPYHNECFIIICQNDSKTKGRKLLPNSIKKKIKIFEYPKPTLADINPLSENIVEKEICDNSEKNKSLAGRLSDLLIKLNEKNFADIGMWSMRDIRKIFRRINKQNNSPEQYQNITENHQILIYILGGVQKNKILNVFEEIIPLIKQALILDDKDIEELRLMITAKAEKKEIDKKTFIMKGKFGKIWEPDINLPNNEFNSFYESLFYSNFSDYKEPLLIYGPSGYKTFLAKKLCSNPNPINLYPETSLSQLLGSTHIRDSFNAKKYYLKEICLICGENDISPFENLLKLYIEKKGENNDLGIKIQEIIDKKNLNKTLKKIVEQLKKNLLDLNNVTDNKNKFGNFTSYFQSGKILQNIFSQKYIILKGIDTILPNVLERFNDLLNYNPKIILNEDLYNTFTDKNKEISNLGNFRVIGISSIDNINNLSEASLNRFTLISTSKYTKEEKILFIKVKCPDCPNKFFTFIEKFEKENDEISLKIINKMVVIYQKLQNKEESKKERNLILSIYYTLLPFLEEKELENLIKILMEVFTDNKINFIFENNKFVKFKFLVPDKESDNPFNFEDKNILSKSTGLSIINLLELENNINKENELYDISFHKSFSNLLDIIHLCLAIHYPLIIEGETGSGKNCALEYISNKLNYNLIKFQLTESTTMDELFGKENIKPNDKEMFVIEETKFYKAIIKSADNIDNETNSIIVLENIEEASSSILEALIQLFDETFSEVLLPFGQEGKKKKFNLILTYDPTKLNNSFQNFFPSQIINNSLIYRLNISTEDDYKDIFNKLRNQEFLRNENTNRIVNDLIISRNFTINSQINKLYSLNDMKKYDSLINQLSQTLNVEHSNNIIEKFIFIQSLMNSNQIRELVSKLSKNNDFKNFKYDIILKFDDKINELYQGFKLIQRLKENDLNEINNEYEGSKGINDEIKESIENDFNNLTENQKLGIIFLLLSIKSKYVSIIQGPSCSGKTHLVKTFAKLCNKKIEILDLTNETDLSLFTGQLSPSSKINKKIIKRIQDIYKKTKNIKDIFEKNNFKIDKPKEWTPLQFDKIISDLTNMDLEDNRNGKLLLEIMKKERNLTSFFDGKKSIFISAMTKGDWVLLNGIESAQPEVFQKLISLCDNKNPCLNLFEK